MANWTFARVVSWQILRWNDCPGSWGDPVHCHTCPNKKEAQRGLKIDMKGEGDWCDTGMVIGLEMRVAFGSWKPRKHFFSRAPRRPSDTAVFWSPKGETVKLHCRKPLACDDSPVSRGPGSQGAVQTSSSRALSNGQCCKDCCVLLCFLLLRFFFF